MMATRKPSKRRITLSTFDRGIRDMPSCVALDLAVIKTMNDLRRACLIELDLTVEGQDGTDPANRFTLENWLEVYGRPPGMS